jgi:hypothetical protein
MGIKATVHDKEEVRTKTSATLIVSSQVITQIIRDIEYVLSYETSIIPGLLCLVKYQRVIVSDRRWFGHRNGSIGFD